MGSFIICKVLCRVKENKSNLARKLLQSVAQETILDWMFELNKEYMYRLCVEVKFIVFMSVKALYQIVTLN